MPAGQISVGELEPTPYTWVRITWQVCFCELSAFLLPQMGQAAEQVGVILGVIGSLRDASGS